MSKAAKYLLSRKLNKERNSDECRVVEVTLPTISSVDVEFSGINMTVSEGFTKKKKKSILKDVSGLFKSGELTAIMGPSGAGKSSLLNALTGFSTQGVSGKIRAGNRICELNKSGSMSSLQAYRRKTCYILQDDRLNPLFTVLELMNFATDLKLGNTITKELKDGIIKEVLMKLGLTGTENTMCGKLSGGQKKRLSIAVELIDNPPVVFLDEPTTGLDSLTSLQCIVLLKNLARDGRTIVCTIHQPSASLYAMFDKVYILAEGMCIYSGPSELTVPYFTALGFQCPKYHNPADYVLEVANGEYGKVNHILAQKCLENKSLVPALPPPHTVENKKQFLQGDRMSIIVRRPHELYKFGILIRRALLHQYRDWTITHLKTVLHLFIGVLLGLLFEHSGKDGSKTVNNLGFLLVSIVYLCYTSLMPAVLKFPLELSVLKKENFNNWYNLKTYYAASIFVSVPLQIWFTFVFSVPSYFISSQPQEYSRFLMFVLVMAVVTLLADAVGNFIGTCLNPINGTFIGAILTCIMLVFAGFLVLFQHMTVTMRVVSHISFLKFGYEALVIALYAKGRKPLDCPYDVDYCHLRYPNEIFSQFMLKEDNFWADITIMSIELILAKFISYFTLKSRMTKST